MAKIFDVIGEESLEGTLVGDHVILVLPENYVLTQEMRYSFKRSGSTSDALSPGRYMFRASNDLNRGLIIGQLVSSLPNCAIYSGREDVIQKYLTCATVYPIDSKGDPAQVRAAARPSTESPTPPLAPLDRNIDSRPGYSISRPVRQRKKSPIDSVYTQVLHKFIESCLKDPHQTKMKKNSMKNVLVNFLQGVIHNMKDLYGELPDNNKISELIIDDLLENEVLEDEGAAYAINLHIAAQCFKDKTRSFVTHFQRKDQEDLIKAMLEHVNKFVQSKDDLPVMQLYQNVSETVNSAYPNCSRAESKNIVSHVMKGAIEQNNLTCFNASIDQIVENPVEYSDKRLVKVFNLR